MYPHSGNLYHYVKWLILLPAEARSSRLINNFDNLSVQHFSAEFDPVKMAFLVYVTQEGYKLTCRKVRTRVQQSTVSDLFQRGEPNNLASGEDYVGSFLKLSSGRNAKFTDSYCYVVCVYTQVIQ